LIDAIQSFSAFLLVLGVLVFVHEFGHFAVAKAFGIGVQTFSLGLGKRIFGFRRGETDYRISLIPLGGYVRMLGDEMDEHRSGAPEEFLSRPRYQRFLVYSAGAALNLLLAWVLVTAVFFFWGSNELIPADDPYPVVVDFASDSTAAAAGILPGDRILAIGGRDLGNQDTFPDIYLEEVSLSPEQEKPLLLERDGQQIEMLLPTGADDRYHLGDPGWTLQAETDGPVEIIEVFEGPANEAGLMSGDRIVGFDGRTEISDLELRQYLMTHADQPIQLQVEREGELLAMEVTPEEVEGRGRIGVSLTSRELRHIEYSFSEAASASLQMNVRLSQTVFKVLGRLLRREISMRTLSGPIEIAQASRQAVRGGLQSVLLLLAFISLQLGIMNLLPIPILDGGHLVILAVESTMRRDLSMRVKERVMMVGLVFLMMLFAAVLYLDVIKAVFSS
jgi:regulator of sigma E protease